MLNKLSLNTIGLNRIGLNRIGKPSRGSSDRPYIDPEVLSALKAVCICYGKSNNDPDRAVVKNLVDPDNPFIISNAAYNLNSGFGLYQEDFTRWKAKANTSITTPSKYILTDSTGIESSGYFLWNRLAKSSFTVKITNIPNGGWMSYRYRQEGDDTFQSLFIRENGIYTLPATIADREVDFFISTVSAPAENWVGLTIEQVPQFQGAFVTDGINDLITSSKTVSEMGVTDEITVVSMIHQIQLNPSSSITNDIRVSSDNNTGSNGRIVVSAENKTGIYGWSRKGNTKVIITKILGDKNDYSLAGENSTNYNNKFSVVGTVDNRYNSSVAWYWTVIANKVLTTDQINQVIAYFNLDRCVEPTVLYDVKRQGLSNDTPDSDWYLKDFSKNGFDMSLFNFAKKGNSGVGKYNFSSINPLPNRFEGTVTSNKCHFTKKLVSDTNNFCDLRVISPNEPIKFKVSGLSDGRKLFFANKSGSGSNYNFDNGEHEVSLSFSEGVGQNSPFGVTGDIGDIDVMVEFIPSHAGALCFDGVEDYGQFVGNLGLKDYTIAVDRAYDGLNDPQVSVIANLIATADCPFLFDFINNTEAKAISFGNNQNVVTDVFSKDRRIAYQSTYTYNGKGISKGNSTNTGTGLIAGRYGNNFGYYSKLVLYSLLLFPYSMSEFLIERQLKKRKAGTLYPDMVEFRPIVKSNVEYQVVDFYIDTLPAVVGNYYPINSKLRIAITIKGAVDEVTSLKVNGVDFGTPSINNNRFTFNGTLSDKSPQKIDITIYQPPQYLTMLSNSTLISNETLIKNE